MFICLRRPFLTLKSKKLAYYLFFQSEKRNFAALKLHIEDSFVVSDGIDIGHGKKIPLWLFGLLY